MVNVPVEEQHVEVEITFIPTHAGGRSGSVSSGYMPQFYYDGRDFDAQYIFIDKTEVSPGETAKAFIRFLSPDLHKGRISVGMMFLCREGHKTVAYGKIKKILHFDPNKEAFRE